MKMAQVYRDIGKYRAKGSLLCHILVNDKARCLFTVEKFLKNTKALSDNDIVLLCQKCVKDWHSVSFTIKDHYGQERVQIMIYFVRCVHDEAFRKCIQYCSHSPCHECSEQKAPLSCLSTSPYPPLATTSFRISS